MLEKAKQLASQEFSRLSGREIKAEECFIVWFSKTLQNWKALVSTNAISSNEKCGDYAEITHNGDKKETYVDVYAKVSNRAIKDQGDNPMPPSDRVIMRLQIERKNVMVEKEKRLGNQDPAQSVILPMHY